MTRPHLKRLTKEKLEKIAYSELIQKKENGSKGSKLKYGPKLQMAEYLCPNKHLSVDDQVQIFQICSQINPLLANNRECVPCVTGCREIMNNFNIFQCGAFNPEKQNMKTY